MISLKITTVGNSTGIILPKEALAKLNVAKGDHIYLTESPSGFLITAYNPDFERQMKLAEEVMDEYKDTLRELAK
jgi:putative addiction module antidote